MLMLLKSIKKTTDGCVKLCDTHITLNDAKSIVFTTKKKDLLKNYMQCYTRFVISCQKHKRTNILNIFLTHQV